MSRQRNNANRRLMMRSLGDLSRPLSRPTQYDRPKESKKSPDNNRSTAQCWKVCRQSSDQVSGWDCEPQLPTHHETIFSLSKNLQNLQECNKQRKKFERKAPRRNHSANQMQKSLQQSLDQQSVIQQELKQIRMVLDQMIGERLHQKRPATAKLIHRYRWHSDEGELNPSAGSTQKLQYSQTMQSSSYRRLESLPQPQKCMLAVVHKAFPCRLKKMRRVAPCTNISYGVSGRKQRQTMPISSNGTSPQFSDAQLYHKA